MKKYLFKTNATMKEYNNEKYWVDPYIVRDKYIDAENLNEALEKYKNLVEEEYVIISNNAIKNKKPMYVDTMDGNTKQVGYVITAKMGFPDDDNYNWSTQYIDLWVNILTIVDTEF